MPIKNILLSVLLIFNIYFAYAIYSLNTEKEEATVIIETVPSAEENVEINYNDYATLYMFKQILPTDAFAEILLPEIETALEDGTISISEWLSIQEKIRNLEELNTIDFSEIYLSQMQKEDLGSTLDQMLEDLGKGASAFSDTLKQDLKSFVEKNKERFKDEETEQNNTPNNTKPQNLKTNPADQSVSL